MHAVVPPQPRPTWGLHGDWPSLLGRATPRRAAGRSNRGSSAASDSRAAAPVIGGACCQCPQPVRLSKQRQLREGSRLSGVSADPISARCTARMATPELRSKAAMSQQHSVQLEVSVGGGGTAAAARHDSQPIPIVLPGMEPNPLCTQLPVFDLSTFLDAEDKGSPEVQRLCVALARCLQQSSALVVRDPRVDTSDNEGFLDLMERYFAQPLEAKMADVRADLAYQVGATPEGVERPRCLRDEAMRQQAARLAPEDQPTIPQQADAKWRFFWRLGDRPASTQFPELNAEPVVPAAFPEWRQVMDGWGGKMLGAVATVAEMAARGFGLEPEAFTSRMQHAPHLLAPTGADLDKHGKLGTVYAGYHFDLNFLTIHGRSRYPGLYAWLASGRRIPVRIPEGCLLLQAGKQMEWLTGGHVKAGFHEVICTEETLAAADRARQEGRPAWRVSSTVFSQIASDVVLQPLGHFAEAPAAAAAYPATPAGKQVADELQMINLKA